MNRITSCVTLALLALVAVAAPVAQTMRQAAPAAAAADHAKVLASLQGSWQMTSSQGQDMTGGPVVLVTIKDNTYIQTVDGATVERGSFKLDVSKKPMTLDMAIVEGDDAGQTQLGIFEVDGLRMRGNLTAPGSTARPTDFTVADGNFAFTAVKK